MPFFFHTATLSEVSSRPRHPEEASIAAISEEFGAYKYVEFDGDGDSGGGGGSSSGYSANVALSLTALSVFLGVRL